MEYKRQVATWKLETQRHHSHTRLLFTDFIQEVVKGHYVLQPKVLKTIMPNK